MPYLFEAEEHVAIRASARKFAQTHIAPFGAAWEEDEEFPLEMYKTAALRLHFKMASLVVADTVASDQGTYTLEIRAKPDTSKVVMTDHGNYVTTFVKRNGQWRALYDIATSEIPATPPAAPATKSPAASKKK